MTEMASARTAPARTFVHKATAVLAFSSKVKAKESAGGSTAVSRALRTLAALICLLAAVFAQAAMAQQACPTLTVTNNNDVVNGDTSSPCALIANSGSDGISLREALTAANNATGPGIITITFAADLSGATITLSADFPPIVRNQISLIGLTQKGQPDINIDASQLAPTGTPIFFVAASYFSMSGLNFPSIPVSNTSSDAVQIGGIGAGLDGNLLAPLNMCCISIIGNAFSNGTGNNNFAISVTAFISSETISEVTIAQNAFTELYEAIDLLGGGAPPSYPTADNAVIEDVDIHGNTFTQMTSYAGVELGNAMGTGNKILRTQIVQNTFSNSAQGVFLDNSSGAQNTVIDETLIAGNVFTAAGGTTVGMVAGVSGGSDNNVISNTQIVNNILNGGSSGQQGIFINDDQDSQEMNNKVSGVSIINDTFVGPFESAIDVVSNGAGITDVSTFNDIFFGNQVNGLTSNELSYSIINQSGFAGVNNNFNADPMFVNPTQNNFTLQSGSPAIGAGTHAGAPAIDLDCQFRALPPSIGAYEFEGPNVCNDTAGSSALLAAVLPESRSAQVNGTVTAFATVINTGTTAASGCSIYPFSNLPGTFVYQTTNPATNAVTGSPNTPVSIAGNDTAQSFVFAVTPSAAFSPNDLLLNFGCSNVPPAPINVGLDTLLVSASTTPTPDVIALGATTQNDGIVHVTNGSPPTGVFAVATDNLGSGDTITVATNTGSVSLPLTITLCQTNPSTGACLQTPSATVATTISSNATPTFGIFVSASGSVPFDPTDNRIFVTFTDSTNAIRGETSVAVETQ